MKKALCAGILAASVVAGYVYWRANQNVYSLSVYAGGYSYGPQWHIGSPPNWIGFTQFTDVGFPNEWGKKRDTPTFTDIDLASHQFRIKSRAWHVGLALALAFAILFWLGFAAWDGLRSLGTPPTPPGTSNQTS